MKLRTWKTACIAFATLSAVLLSLLVLLLTRDNPDSIIVHKSAADILELKKNSNIGSLVLLKKLPPSLLDSWLPCDGQRLKKVEHAALFAVIGNRFTHSAVDKDSFCLPDYRGLTSFDFSPEDLAWWARTLIALPSSQTYYAPQFIPVEISTMFDEIESPKVRIAEMMWVVKAR